MLTLEYRIDGKHGRLSSQTLAPLVELALAMLDGGFGWPLTLETEAGETLLDYRAADDDPKRWRARWTQLVKP